MPWVLVKYSAPSGPVSMSRLQATPPRFTVEMEAMAWRLGVSFT